MRAPEKTVRRARALRGQLSLPEVVLWQALRKGRLAGLRFRRQHPIGPYILDFYCPAARLAVEVDGLARGVTVLRVTAADVLRDEMRDSVLMAIEQAAAPSGSLREPPPPRSGGGTDGSSMP